MTYEQEMAVSYKNGPLFVTGPAGCGKTVVLIQRIKNLLTETDRQILVITFTSLAKIQIKDKLQEIENGNNRVFVGSFISFCQNVLEKHGHLIGYKKNSRILFSESDRQEIIEEIIQSNPTLSHLFKNKKNIKNVIFKANQRLASFDKDIVEDESIKLLYSSYRSYMNSFNLVDCDDLIYGTYKLFDNYPNVAALYRRNYGYICVDDAQKMNQAQYNLLKKILSDENRNIMLIANIPLLISNQLPSNNILNQFKEDFHPAIVELNIHYSIPLEIYNYVNRIIPIQENPSKSIFYTNDGKCIQKSCQDQYEEARYVVSEIKSINRNENNSYRAITISARNVYLLSAIKDELEKNNIPYSYQNSLKNLELVSSYGKYFKEAIRKKINTHSNHQEKNLLAHVESVKEELLLKDRDCRLDEFIVSKINSIINEMNCNGYNFSFYIDELKEMIVRDWHSNDEEKTLAYFDFTSIENAWSKFSKKTNDATLRAFFNWMSKKQISPKKEINTINLNTIETMIGFDNDILFLIGLDDGMFPDYRIIQKGDKALEQEKIKLCSAILRAKSSLYITYPYERIMPWGETSYRKKSRFLPD